MGGARDGHATAATFSLLGELHINPPMILGDQTVVEVIVLHLQEDGLTVHIVPWLQEVDRHGGDEDAVAVDGLHGDEAGEDKQSVEHTVRVEGRTCVYMTLTTRSGCCR